MPNSVIQILLNLANTSQSFFFTIHLFHPPKRARVAIGQACMQGGFNLNPKKHNPSYHHLKLSAQTQAMMM